MGGSYYSARIALSTLRKANCVVIENVLFLFLAEKGRSLDCFDRGADKLSAPFENLTHVLWFSPHLADAGDTVGNK